MNAPLRHIAVVGAGRMGEGIALAFAQAGLQVSLIDLKQRAAQADHFQALRRNLETEAHSLVALELIGSVQAEQLLARIQLLTRAQGEPALAGCRLVFEAVPEMLAAKREAMAWIDRHAPADGIIASTTSTFLVTELAQMVSAPQRLLSLPARPLAAPGEWTRSRRA